MLKKCLDGHYENNMHEDFVFIMVYNSDGTYRGQWQSNAVDDGDIFLSSCDGRVNGELVPPLTKEEMSLAVELVKGN